MLFSKSILSYFKQVILKSTYIFIVIIFLSCVFLSIMNTQVKAAQYTEKYNSTSFNSTTYPGYVTLINSLKQAHPNWTFTILYTGLDWNQVLKNETTAHHGRSLVDGSKTGEWVCSNCAENRFDNGSWKCASEATVAYYMDPRNSLFEDYVFQFENLQWVEGLYTTDGINKILSDCYYMQGSKITYTKTDGKTATISKSYAQVIYDAAKLNNISPYHLAARIRQEQGPGNNASSTATGKYSGYVGYYNFFNINASGSGNSAIIQSGLSYAKDKGWTDPEKSIQGGAQFLANDYINEGQNTLYLQKFDVDNSDGTLYWHQYQQNVSAAKSESSEVLSTYRSIDSKLSWAFNFVIPVYKNMPESKCLQPGSQSIVTQNIEVTDAEVIVRSSKSTTANKLATLTKGAKVLRIEIGNTKTNGYYWDKVVLDNGTKGYIISSGIKLLEDVTNCNIRGVATEPGNLRNGPGTSGTTIITTLTVGQNVTIVEKGKYKNINGENWTRIYLSDGRQGYIVERYLNEISSSGGGTITSDKDIVKVVAEIGLSVRENPGTDQKTLKVAEKGDLLTRIEKEVSNDDGYVWDKVITDDGIQGYVARGDSEGPYIEIVSTIQPTEVRGTGFKTSGTNVVCEPNITITDIKKSSSDVVIKNASGSEVTSGNIGTGYTIKVDGMTYTVVKKGDTNGDGLVKATDYMRIKNYIMNTSSLTEAQKQAADVNKDGVVKATDYMKIKNYIMGTSNIDI